ncbi:MAG TPA: hypothetical protein DDW30_04690 [Clostridiales bacterium]|nr:hypothetical protein [Clostridiales bacterium]
MKIKMHPPKVPISRKLLLILILLTGWLTMLVFEYILGTRAGLLKARERLKAESAYISEQCILYDEVGSEEETKSLIRIADKALQLQRIYREDGNRFSDETIHEYMENFRLTGIILTEAGNESGTLFFSQEKSMFSVWKEVLEKSVSVMDHYGKVYSDRFFHSDGYCYDFSVVARQDKRGLILCYMQQETAAVQGTELSVRTLLSGYTFTTDGIVAVTNENRVIGSNSEDLIEQNASECELIRLAQNAKNPNRILPRINLNGTVYYTLWDRSKSYCVYLFYPAKEVFTSRSMMISYSSVLYAILAGVVLWMWFHAESRRRITEMRNAEQYHAELNRLANDAIRANDAKTDFLRRMSHDIRTPVNGIRGMLDMAEYYDDNAEKRKECYEKMREASGYLLELVTDVLDMSKLEQGDVMWKDEKFRIDRVFDEICSMMKQQAREKGVELSSQTENIRHSYLVGSAVCFRRVCLNLIGNAIKYNRMGGTVLVSCREEGEEDGKAEFVFTCADTGIGMSEEFMQHMYEPFAQEDLSFKASYNGTGLGLAIVKKLVDRQGGTISVESTRGVGTTFTVRLRFRIDTEGEDRPQTRAIQILREDGDHALSGAKILIAEDNDLNMEIAQFILERSGATVVRAVNGKEAVDRFMASKAGELDLILMDLMMPVMDGLLATQVIRASGHPDAKTVPIVAMTANAYADDVERSLKSGMNGHLAKPLDAGKLVDTVVAYYKKRKAEKENHDG